MVYAENIENTVIYVCDGHCWSVFLRAVAIRTPTLDRLVVGVVSTVGWNYQNGPYGLPLGI